MQRSLHLQEAVQGVLPVQAEEGGAALRAVSVGKQEARLRRRMQESQRKGTVTDRLLVRPSFQRRFLYPNPFLGCGGKAVRGELVERGGREAGAAGAGAL